MGEVGIADMVNNPFGLNASALLEPDCPFNPRCSVRLGKLPMVLQSNATIPHTLPLEGRIFFGISDLRIRSKTARCLRSIGFTVDSAEPMVLVAEGGSNGLGSVLRDLAEELTPEEFSQVRLHVAADSHEPFAVSTVLKMKSAPELVSRLESEWLISVLEAGFFVLPFSARRGDADRPCYRPRMLAARV